MANLENLDLYTAETTEGNKELSKTKESGIFVPRRYVIGTRFLPEKICPCRNWYDAHQEIYNANLEAIKHNGQKIKMPVLSQAVDLLLYASSSRRNDCDSEFFYDELIKHRNPWRTASIDAFFKLIKGEMIMYYDTVYDKEKGIFQKESVVLKNYLIELGWIDLHPENFTEQGLPRKLSKTQKPKEGKVIYYHPPVSDCVARFSAASYGSGLGCYWDPSDVVASLGVIPCAEDAEAA